MADRTPGFLGLSLVLGAVLSLACNEQAEPEACYPLDPWIDFDGHPYERGFCDYGVQPKPEDPPEGVNSDEFRYCFDLSEGETCDGCPLEDTKQYIIGRFMEETQCEEPVHDFIRGCYGVFDDGKTCCYSAVIASTCVGEIIE